MSCPLCKVTSSEKEIVENLFLTASEEPGMDDEIPDTHMCSVSLIYRIHVFSVNLFLRFLEL